MKANRLLLPLLLAACSSPEDQAAKARIFSPEDPPKVLLAAQEPLEPEALAKRPAMVERILSISAQEAAARLGPHEQKASIHFEWKRDGERVGLQEERFVALGPRGDFHVRIENDRDQGMEWIRVDGKSYTRSRYARFRERRRDRGASEHVVDDAYAALHTFYGLIHGAVQLSGPEPVTYAGRPALRYAAALGKAKEAAEDELPPIRYPKEGPDPDTRLRLDAAAQSRARVVGGTLTVDAETGVPLEAKLRATLAKETSEGEAILELRLELGTASIGRDPGVLIPEHLEDAARSPGVVSTLRSYGLGAKDKTDEKPTETPDEE